MLKIKGLHKSYKNKKVLKGVDLYVKKGEIKGLIGVNGAGKTTLIECVCGVKKFDTGQILINDIDLVDKKKKKYSGQCKECIYKNNKEKQREYYKNNKEEIVKHRKEYYKSKRFIYNTWT